MLEVTNEEIEAGTYKVGENGLLQFSVTQILQLALERVFFKSSATDRGTEIHKERQENFEAGVDDGSLYFKTLTSFKMIEYHHEVRGVRVFNDAFNVSGFADCVGTDENMGTILVDLKTGKKYDTHPMQLGGYIYLLDLDVENTKCYLVYEDLNEVVEVNARNAYNSFMAQLNLFEDLYNQTANIEETTDARIVPYVILKEQIKKLESLAEQYKEDCFNAVKEIDGNKTKVLGHTVFLTKNKAKEGYWKTRSGVPYFAMIDYLKEQGVIKDFCEMTEAKPESFTLMVR